MNAKYKNSNGWILCPSTSFPGKFYYFNVVTGETAWSSDAEKKPFKRVGNFSNIHKVTNSHTYPEPTSPPMDSESPSNSFSNNGYTYNRFPSYIAAKQTCPTFGQVSFPKYVSNMQFMPNIIWTPVPLPMAPCMPVPQPPVYGQNFEKRRKVLNQGTQTSENIFMPKIRSPVFKSNNVNFNSTSQKTLAFSNFNNPKKTFTNSATTAKNVFGSKQNIIQSYENQKSLFADSQTAKLCKKPTKRSWSLSEPTVTNSESTDVTNDMGNNCRYEMTKVFPKSNHSIYESTDQKLSHAPKMDQLKLSDASKVEQSKDQSLDQIKIKKTEETAPESPILQENDLRLVLLAKKRKDKNFDEICDKPNKCQKLSQEALAKDSNLKKSVSFYLEDVSDEECFSSDVDSDNAPVNLNIRYLRSLAEPHMRTDRWYIIPDMDVLMNHFQLIKQFAQTVQESAENTSPATLQDDVLNCCILLLQQKYHTVIITKDETLKNKAKSLNLHSYHLNEIQQNEEDSNPIFDLKRIKKLFNDTNDEDLPSTSNYIPNLSSKTQNQNSLLKKSTLPTIDNNKLNLEKHENLFSKAKNEKTQSNSNFLFNYKIPKNKHEIDKHARQETFPSHSTIISPIMEKLNLKEGFNHKQVASDKNKASLKKEKYIFANSNSESVIGQFEDDTKESIAEGYSIEDNLRRFRVKNKMIEERVKSRLNEWDCTLTQIMEDTLTEVLQNNGRQINKRLPPPWTLLQAAEYITQYYSKDHLVRRIAWKLSILLSNVKRSNGKLQESVRPNDFMQVLGCCLLLIQALQLIHPSIRALSTAEDLLLYLLKLIEDPSLDLDPIQNDDPLNVGYKSEDKDLERVQNYIKKPEEVLQYLAKHYPEWDSYKARLDVNNQKHNEDKTFQKPNVKVIRTVGKDLNLLKISNKNKITMSKKEDMKTDTDSNDSNTSVIKNKRVNAEINKTQTKDDKNNISNNKDAVNDDLNVTTHENTFGAAKDTAGPKVVRNVNVIEAFEKKLRPNFDLDVLDYSDYLTKDSYDSENENVDIKNDESDNYNDKNDINDADAEDNDFNDGHSNDSGNFNLDHDSGIENDPGITTIPEFLNVLYQFLKIVYDFIYASLSKLCKKGSKHENNIIKKWNEIYLFIDPLINQLKSIITRESDDNSSGYSHLVKSGIDTTRYRQIVSECLKCIELLKQIMLDVNIQETH